MLKNKPVLLRPTLFAEKHVVAAFTTRHGGASDSPFDSLNLGLSTGDEPDVVARNRMAVFHTMGIVSSQVAFAGQVHGRNVEVVSAPGLYRQTDGLVTTTRGLLLAITAADCAAVLLADSEAGVVGACHAGWRGAVGGIVERTVDLMKESGAKTARIAAYVSPCIGFESFEVGPEVASQFDAAFVRSDETSDRAFVDLKGDIRRRLETRGLRSSSIEISPHCTMRAVGDFYSHRAEHGRTGRMMGLIGLRGE